MGGNLYLRLGHRVGLGGRWQGVDRTQVAGVLTLLGRVTCSHGYFLFLHTGRGEIPIGGYKKPWGPGKKPASQLRRQDELLPSLLPGPSVLPWLCIQAFDNSDHCTFFGIDHNSNSNPGYRCLVASEKHVLGRRWYSVSGEGVAKSG